MYDVIGDVHGHAEELVELLERMGYRREGGAFRHADRTAIFLGDWIDRGPNIRQALEVVREQAAETRDKVSGVNLDEEAASLIRFQQAYQASAKVMQVAGVLFDAVLAVR